MCLRLSVPEPMWEVCPVQVDWSGMSKRCMDGVAFVTFLELRLPHADLCEPAILCRAQFHLAGTMGEPDVCAGYGY